MVSLTVLSRDAIEELAPIDHPHAIITIKSPQGRWANVPDNPQCKGILRLEFHDVEQDEDGQRMSDQQAREIMAFVTRLYPEIVELAIQCRGGQSRSAGIAAALAQSKTGDASFYFKHAFFKPNRDVYAKLLKSARMDLKSHIDDLMLQVEALNGCGKIEEATALNEALAAAKHYGGRFGEDEQA